MRRKKKKEFLKLYTGNVDDVTFKPLLFIDFEYITSSYRQNGKRVHLQEIIEAAGIYVSDLGYFRFNEIVQPRIYLSQLKDTQFNKITKDELSQGVEMSTVVSVFKQFYKPGVSKILSWGGSDLFNFNNLCFIYGIQYHIRKDDYIDLSQKFRRFYNLNQAITLEKALSFVNITDKFEKHRALPDAEMLLRLFDKMVEDGYLDADLVKG